MLKALIVLALASGTLVRHPHIEYTDLAAFAPGGG
jgi:hypothetical protein